MTKPCSFCFLINRAHKTSHLIIICPKVGSSLPPRLSEPLRLLRLHIMNTYAMPSTTMVDTVHANEQVLQADLEQPSTTTAVDHTQASSKSDGGDGATCCSAGSCMLVVGISVGVCFRMILYASNDDDY